MNYQRVIYSIENILAKALRLEKLQKEEIILLLQTREENQVQALFKTACEMRAKYFGAKIFTYGFLYTSTYCRNNCRFCFYRSGNENSLRYRKNDDEIITSARQLADSGVHLIDLTMGEDPYYFSHGEDGFDRLIRLVERVKKAVELPLMVSPGAASQPLLEELARAGASWYACYQETHNPLLFNKLRPGQSYEERLQTKRLAHRAGMLTEEGVLAGVGESPVDIAESIMAMDSLDADQARAMNFIPRAGTPMANVVIDDPLREPVYIAVMRLALPGRLIPASLDVAGLPGLKNRLAAGANVVTSLVPPQQGLLGVAHSHLDIEENRRSVSGIIPVLEECGLQAASSADYRAWIENRISYHERNAGDFSRVL